MRLFSRVAIPAALIACAFALASCERLIPGTRTTKLSEAREQPTFNCELWVARRGAGDIVEAKFYIKPGAALQAEGGELLADGNNRPVLVLAANDRIEAPGTCVLRAFQLGKAARVGWVSLSGSDKMTGKQRDALRKLMSDPRLRKGSVDECDLKAFQIAVWAVWSGTHEKPEIVSTADRFHGPPSEDKNAGEKACELLESSGWPVESGSSPTIRLSANDYLKMGDWCAANAGQYENDKPNIRRWALWSYQQVSKCRDASDSDRARALAGERDLKAFANVTRAKPMTEEDIRWVEGKME